MGSERSGSPEGSGDLTQRPGDMTREARDIQKRHLSPDDLDRCLARREESRLPAQVDEHLGACPECRAEVEFLRALDRHLARLSHPGLSPGFATRVMARVRLPTPWRERALATLRRRWAPIATATAALAVTIGGMAYWLFGQQGLTPVALGGLIVEGARTLAVRGSIAIGRFFYDSGLMDLGSTLWNDVGLDQALMAMAALGLLVVTAALATMQLVAVRVPRLSRVLRS